MIHLGYTTQEFRIETRFVLNNNNTLDNNPPDISISEYKSYCEGEKICIEVDALDQEYEDQFGKQNWKDTLELDWNSSIPGATWELDSTTNFYTVNGEHFAQRKGKLCWQTEVVLVRGQPAQRMADGACAPEDDRAVRCLRRGRHRRRRGLASGTRTHRQERASRDGACRHGSTANLPAPTYRGSWMTVLRLGPSPTGIVATG
jgi:hypothetical protein